MLLDRADELMMLDHVLDGARHGRSGALVIRGEPGIGKTVLLEHVVRSAADFLVARVVGVESEWELGFAGLHQLLIPFLSCLEQLPAPQRRALRSAFGLEPAADDATADRFLVGLATLTVLSDRATEQPLLVVVDDAHWLDQESCEVLGFVARRLHDDRIAVLFGVREPQERPVPLDGVPELWLSGLPASEARQLIDTAAPGQVDRMVADRMLTESGGNPLALVELATALSRDQLAGKQLLPVPLPVGRRLEQAFLRRIRTLPAATQTLLLLAAADRTGDSVIVWQAADRLGLDRLAADPPEEERLIIWSPRIAFRHPLIRSAVYGGAAPAERRRVFEALAADDHVEVDLRAWYQAAAASGPDEGVATQLDQAAERARARGGYAATAFFLTRAAELTPDDALRTRRLLTAADSDLLAGAPSRALALVDRAGPLEPDALDGARALRLRGGIAFVMGEGAQAPALLLRAARALQPLDLHSARETYLEAMEAALWAGRTALLEVARATDSAPRIPESVVGTADLLLEGFTTLVVGGYHAGAKLLRRGIARLLVPDLSAEEGLRWLGLGIWAAAELFDEAAWRALAGRCIQLARDHGALTLLPLALDYLGELDMICGRFDRAQASLAEGRDIAAATGNPRLLGTAVTEMFLLVYQGQETEVREAAGSLIQTSAQRGQGLAGSFAQAQLCVLDLSLGRYADAVANGRSVFAADPPYLGTHVLPNLVEAASRISENQAAAIALTRLEQRVHASGTGWGLGVLARSRALVADDGDAELLYEQALGHLAGSEAAVDLARAHLVYGEWLRRRRRRRDAREQLSLAHDQFQSMGADAFAERARVELLATGGRARKRTPESRDDLTPQEAQIARLAADGGTSREIAAHLFISPTTVDHHLKRVYRKLDVRSRRELPRVLDGAGQIEKTDQ